MADTDTTPEDKSKSRRGGLGRRGKPTGKASGGFSNLEKSSDEERLKIDAAKAPAEPTSPAPKPSTPETDAAKAPNTVAKGGATAGLGLGALDATKAGAKGAEKAGAGTSPLAPANLAKRALAARAGLGKFASQNRTGLLAGGGAGALIGLVMLAFVALLPLKLEHMVRNLYKYAFRRLTHTETVRRQKAISYYFKERMGLVTPAEQALVDKNLTVAGALRAKLYNGGIEKRLSDKGYKITYDESGGLLKGEKKILSIRGPTGEEASVSDGAAGVEKKFDLMYEKKSARAAIDDVVKDITKDESWLTRLSVKLKLTRLTHTTFHPLDIIKQPYNKVKTKIANAVIQRILETDITSRAAVSVIEFLLNGKGGPGLADELQTKIKQNLLDYASKGGNVDDVGQALSGTTGTDIITAAEAELSTKVVEEITVKTTLQVVSETATIVGIVALVADLYCKANSALEHGSAFLEKLARDKAMLEYMHEAAFMTSSAAQVRSGKADSATFAAASELLDDKNGNDYSQSNNFQRAAGYNNVPAYVQTDDCSTGAEMCVQKQPNHIADATGIGAALKDVADIANDPTYKGLSTFAPIPLPGSYTVDGLCKGPMKIVNWILGLAGSVVGGIIHAIDHFFLGDHIHDAEKALIGKATQAILEPLVRHLFPSVVNTDTRGPNLANAGFTGLTSQQTLYLKDKCANGETDDTKIDAKCKLNTIDQQKLDQKITQEARAEDSRLSLWSKLTTLDRPGSLANVTLSALPATPHAAFHNTATAFASFFRFDWLMHSQVLLAGVTGSAHADIYQSDEQTLGVTQYGWTEDKLQSDPYGSEDMKAMDTSESCALMAGVDPGGDMPAECDESGQSSGDESANSAVGGATVDLSSVYKPSDNVSCAAGTTDMGIETGYYNGSATTIRLCALPLHSTGEESNPNATFYVTGANSNALVNSRASGAFLALVNAMKAAGLPVAAESSFRTMAHQQALYNAPHTRPVATPGYSNHQMGLAIDFTCPNELSSSNECFKWMSQNAGNYGIKNLPSEAWHWSVDGH